MQCDRSSVTQNSASVKACKRLMTGDSSSPKCTEQMKILSLFLYQKGYRYNLSLVPPVQDTSCRQSRLTFVGHCLRRWYNGIKWTHIHAAVGGKRASQKVCYLWQQAVIASSSLWSRAQATKVCNL